MAAQFSALGWGVAVITPQDYATDEDILRFSRGQSYLIRRVVSGRGPARGFLSRWTALARQIRFRRPLAIIATGAKSVWTAAMATRFYKIPLVAIGHGTEFGVKRFSERVVTRWAFGKADVVISVSQFTRGLMQSLGVCPRRELVICNGADDRQFYCLPPSIVFQARRDLVPQAEHLLLTVGSVTERKGQETVIRALPLVLRQFPRTHYLMAGLPVLQPILSTLATQIGVQKHVHFLGRLEPDQLLRTVNASDVFLMTSRTTATGDCEGFGIAIVEAAFCGKPSVVSANSGPAEAIVDGITGLTVPERDERSTARAICRLLADPALRCQMGHAARERALREQTWGACLRKYDQLLCELVSQASSCP